MNEFSFENQLEEVFSRDVNAIIKEHQNTFDQLSTTIGETFILFGAGRLGQFALAGLSKAGIKPLSFADNNPKLWNTTVDGLQVLSPQDAARQFSEKAIFVVTVYTSQPVWNQLIALGLKVISFAELAWRYSATLLPHSNLELPYKIFEQRSKVMEAFSLWKDAESRNEYVGQIKWHTSLDRRVLPSHLPQKDIYFPSDLLTLLHDEIFVDTGAFDGDTVQEFLKRRNSSFKQIIAIEPDSENYQKLTNRLSLLSKEIINKILTIRVAVGACREEVRFTSSGAASSIGNGKFVIQCDTLDDLLTDYHPTYIKMDIEGAESEAIIGAQNIIANDTPALAICLYHHQEHLWDIPLLIRSYSDQYNLFLRRYADECWELVLYAIPTKRLKR